MILRYDKDSRYKQLLNVFKMVQRLFELNQVSLLSNVDGTVIRTRMYLGVVACPAY